MLQHVALAAGVVAGFAAGFAACALYTRRYARACEHHGRELLALVDDQQRVLEHARNRQAADEEWTVGRERRGGGCGGVA